MLVPGGFGSRGVEGKVLAAKYCREEGVPYLGVCLGMQVMVIEYVRSVLGHKKANSEEFMEKETALEGSDPDDLTVAAADMKRPLCSCRRSTLRPWAVRIMFYCSSFPCCDVCLSLDLTITPCLHSLAPHATSLTITPLPQSINRSIDIILTSLITLQVTCGWAAGPQP